MILIKLLGEDETWAYFPEIPQKGDIIEYGTGRLRVLRRDFHYTGSERAQYGSNIHPTYGSVYVYVEPV